MVGGQGKEGSEEEVRIVKGRGGKRSLRRKVRGRVGRRVGTKVGK